MGNSDLKERDILDRMQCHLETDYTISPSSSSSAVFAGVVVRDGDELVVLAATEGVVAETETVSEADGASTTTEPTLLPRSVPMAGDSC